MRLIALLLAVSPSYVFADTIIARIAPTEVTVFTQGAEVTRKGKITLPAGVHEVVIPDMRPTRGGMQTPEITLAGAVIISEKWQDRNPTPQTEPDTAEYNIAKAALDTAQDAVNAVNDEIATNLLVKSAANAQIAFLQSLATSDTLPDGINTLRDLSQMISEETLKAHKAIQQADIVARKLVKDLPDLQDAVAKAQRTIDTLLPPSNDFAQLSLTISVPKAITSELTVTYLTRDAGWRPVYDLRLTTSATPTLVVERGALVAQNSGERWKNVALTLSTVGLSDQAEPNQIRPQRLRISEPTPITKRAVTASPQADFAGVSEIRVEEPIMLEDASMATADLSGIAVQYSFDYPMSVDTGTDFSRVTLGSLDFEAEIEARAIPLYNDTAFRMVSFTNTSGERLLPADASLYVDDRLISNTQVQQIVPGAETKIGFGPIQGLRLTRTILNRNEGDRGIISRSNENTEAVRIDVENLTGEAWNITMLDRVPFTEQEDLTIDWSATPRPITTDYKDQRGVLHWDLDVNAGETQSIKLDTKITWPDGMVLR
jgi:uncharacterized protein (TIGR02231 family)